MLRTGRTNIEDIEPASSHPTPPRLLEGYPTFAEFIARDNDATIYRKFESLSARNLLYKQSELHELERRLEELDWEDARDIDNEEAQQGARLWEHFRNDTNARAILRRELQEKIETKIKAYRTSLGTRIAINRIDIRSENRRSNDPRKQGSYAERSNCAHAKKHPDVVYRQVFAYKTVHCTVGSRQGYIQE